MSGPTRSNPYILYPKDRRRAYKMWERHRLGALRKEDLKDPYERLLLDDWIRCDRLGVDAEMRKARVLSEEEIQRVKQGKAFLLDKARMVLDRVRDLLTGVPGILIFTDENGTILHVTGDQYVKEKAAESSNLVEGGLWGEVAAGTNGIGTAIARKGPVHVYSTEHFCEAWHQWTCAGAPVLDPFGNKVLGVVDFTTFEKDFRMEAVALSQSLAENIAGELLVQIKLERLQLIHQFEIYSARYPADAVLVYDRLGQLVRATQGFQEEGMDAFHGNLTTFTTLPKEVRQVFAPSSDAPFGTVVVMAKPRSAVFSMPPDATLAQIAVYGDFVTSDAEVKRILRRIEKIIPTELNVLLIGETGTGKELIASYIHSRSKRRDGPFVAVNCGALSKELFESRLFGYVRGGFTGADPRGRKGLFEAASGGTLFLDEIGELPLDIQAALLRVLETGAFRRIGSDRERTANCRIIAATNRSLLECVQEGTFRSDLYYRLSVVRAEIPPLRDRPSDIPVLIEHTMKSFCRRHGIPEKRVGPEALGVLTEYRWPGNARELRNVVEAAVVCADEVITPADLPPEVLKAVMEQSSRPAGDLLAAPDQAVSSELSVREHERRLILMALRKYKKISLAARALGMSRSTLYRRFEELGIDRDAVRAKRGPDGD